MGTIWERLGVKNLVVPITDDGNQMGTGREVKILVVPITDAGNLRSAAGAKMLSVFEAKLQFYMFT